MPTPTRQREGGRGSGEREDEERQQRHLSNRALQVLICRQYIHLHMHLPTTILCNTGVHHTHHATAVPWSRFAAVTSPSGYASQTACTALLLDELYVKSTRCPLAAIPSTTALPIPRLPPVTTTCTMNLKKEGKDATNGFQVGAARSRLDGIPREKYECKWQERSNPPLQLGRATAAHVRCSLAYETVRTLQQPALGKARSTAAAAVELVDGFIRTH